MILALALFAVTCHDLQTDRVKFADLQAYTNLQLAERYDAFKDCRAKMSGDVFTDAGSELEWLTKYVSVSSTVINRLHDVLEKHGLLEEFLEGGK